MAKKTKSKQVKSADQQDESLVRAFFGGFLWPVKMIGRGLAWLSHRFPLKHIGHGLRWFSRLKVVRFVGRMLGLKYVAESWKELKLVTWPTFKESRRLTTAVIIFSIIFGLLIAIVDFALDKLFREVILN